MKKCPFCAEDIQDAALKCKHCGEMLGEANLSVLAVPTMAKSTEANLVERSPAQPLRGCGWGLIGCGGLSVLLSLAGIGTMAGQSTTPAIAVSIVILLGGVGLLANKIQLPPVFKGTCPYCETVIEVDSNVAGATCPICKKRVVIRDSKFHQV